MQKVVSNTASRFKDMMRIDKESIPRDKLSQTVGAETFTSTKLKISLDPPRNTIKEYLDKRYFMRKST
jgi:hypothetical protein